MQVRQLILLACDKPVLHNRVVSFASGHFTPKFLLAVPFSCSFQLISTRRFYISSADWTLVQLETTIYCLTKVMLYAGLNEEIDDVLSCRYRFMGPTFE